MEDPKVSPEQRRETVEYFALQALFRWPGAARELDVTPQHFRGSAHRAALAKAALEAQFLSPQGSVPIQTTAATAGVPMDVAKEQFGGGLFDPAAGRAYLSELIRLEQSYRLRRAVESAVRDSLPEELEDALQAVMSQHARETARRSAGSLPSMQRLSLDYIASREALTSSGREEALPYGPTLSKLQHLLRGGHHRGEVTTVIAGPGVGKTTFSSYLQNNLARLGIYSLMFSGEMSEELLAERYVHAEAGVGLDVKLSVGDLRRAGDNILRSEAAARPIVDARPILPPEHMLRVITTQKARYGDLGLVVVDHIGKVKRKGDSRDEWIRFGDAAEALKEIAMATKVPITVLQHMTTADGANETPGWEPTLSSGRGGGKSSFETDNMLAVWRSGGQTWVKVLKCRMNGAAKGQKVELMYNPQLQSFAEIDTEDHRGRS